MATQPTPAKRKRSTGETTKPAPERIAEPQNAPAPVSADAMLSAKAAAAAEPPKDRDPAKLAAAFRTKLDAVLAKLAAEKTPFKFDEGFRTVERQQWLYGSGRPAVKPYGRSGPIVTHKDGVKELSNHQGNGKAGSGRAADCYPAKANGKIIWPPPPGNDPRWKRFADVAREQGLDAGYYWTDLKDLPHIELK
ncbi:MAG: hypothetical protein DMF56_17170 [Acidobacteria bacterium]|nr:MAG: hypothetical protein DMF56_17170 [Acidobacteriota bacterium]